MPWLLGDGKNKPDWLRNAVPSTLLTSESLQSSSCFASVQTDDSSSLLSISGIIQDARPQNKLLLSPLFR